MKDYIKSLYLADARVGEIISCQDKEKHIAINGLVGSAKAYITAAVAEKTLGQHLVVCPDKESAAYFYNDLENIFDDKERDYGKKQILFYPTSYKRPYEPEKTDNTYILSRTEVLQRISTSDRKTIIVTYPEALAEKVVTRSAMAKNTLTINVKDTITMDFLIDKLLELGFNNVDFVIEPGQFAIRGGIVDVFSFANDYPYRIEFFADDIDSIRSFNPIDQLSIEQFNRIVLLPNLQEKVTQEKRETLLKYIDKNTLVWIEETDILEERINAEYKRAITAFENFEDKDGILSPDLLFADGNETILQLKELKTNSFGKAKIFGELKTFDFDTTPQPVFNKNFDLLLENIKQLKKENYSIYFFSESEKQLERISSILNEKSNSPLEMEFFKPVMHSIKAGFIDKQAKTACYTDHQVFERYHRFRLREGFAASQALTIKDLCELKPGDYVTHIDYGIGRFDGLETIDNNGKKQETLRIVYQNGDLLYVSIHSLNRIAKYSGKDGCEPKLNRLGSGAWEKLKNKTKSRVKDIARELIKLYAERKNSNGFKFLPDTYLQTELEASFIYEDTPDQLRATLDVKRDMESEHPMDRLVCGDVGFGKTEVAIRAAFKAVCDSKQVAVLVPTTVLALQHYHTFKQRLKNFPANIDYINRFKSAKEQKEVLEKLKNGKIDIIIGTHRLIGKDVVFKDLGLLIIDEEQKFGVSAKEKLKQLKTNVDTLTLTATPIPRTLQFSMMGARDLSIINTPPPNRYPIETEIRTFNQELIRDAIQYELARDGQVFFIHNRVQNIEYVREFIEKCVPGVKVAVGHGQMPGDILENIMLDFIDGAYDVLLCTTIVESGLDIPNANTIIINDAHKYGLSDLHQLRGRVGRSNKKAFCYLLAPQFSTLSDEAQKRLRALEEFSDLGGGFNIAMRDLDIRGAGNLLGAEQSGFINDIGFETYHKILDEAILELKETEFQDLLEPEKGQNFVSDCVFQSDLEVLLPNDYVDSATERISLYTELDHIKNEEGLARFANNLTDRFGPIPRQTQDLINTVRLRWLAKDLGFEKISLKNNVMTAHFVGNADSPYYQTNIFQNILIYAANHPKRCKVKEMENKLTITFAAVDTVKDALTLIKELSNNDLPG